METGDRRVMERVARGDQRAFAELAEQFGPKLMAVARRLLRSHADAEDAVQRALLQSYEAAASYDSRWAVSTWLYRILTNVCVDELRRRAVRTAHVAAAPPDEPRRDRAGELASRVDLGRALERVPREARVLLALHYVNGLSNGELARIRGISINTVKSQLARGKGILRRALSEGGRS
jgi:RNA polymerase sigma-70 factor, ECF subfamily